MCVDPSDGREVGHSLLDTTVKGAGKAAILDCGGGGMYAAAANLCKQ